MAMWKYLKEENDNLNMDIQVGPGEEVEASADCENDCCCENPVDKAKMDPNSIVVAKKDNCEGCSEFYVSCADVVKYADLNEKTVLESLNDIIACNEDYGISASNLVIVMDESTRDYARNLERNGAACMFVNEADDINMDIQVGPNGDAMEVSEDPQEANPVDAVKRQYDSVVVASQDKDFFVDVEDVQKCADMNCESVIETLNGIIAANEDYDINTGNLHVVVDENCGYADINTLEEAGVNVVFTEAFDGAQTPEEKRRKDLIKKVGKFLKDWLIDNGCSSSITSTFYIGGENKSFVKGTGNRMLIGIDGKRSVKTTTYSDGTSGFSTDNKAQMETRDKAIKAIKDNKTDLLKSLNDEYNKFEFTNVSCASGRFGVFNAVFTVKEKDNKKDE